MILGVRELEKNFGFPFCVPNFGTERIEMLMKIFVVIIVLLGVMVLIGGGLIVSLIKICRSQSITIRLLEDFIDEMKVG